MTARILLGDCRKVLREFDVDVFDSCVTDPPYHLKANKNESLKKASPDPAQRVRAGVGFMGMRWDGGDVAMRPETWAEVLRVLKPGAHLIAFAGTRTHHRIFCAIEDAGFEIRDTIAWLYGSGFPKSHNLGGAWEGWGTALKPAFEPIVVARKPFRGTVAANVERHGTGALNIAGCRIDSAGEDIAVSGKGAVPCRHSADAPRDGAEIDARAPGLGRWPANVAHDGSEEVVSLFPKDAGAFAPVRGTEPSAAIVNVYGARQRPATYHHGDHGSAARFYYCAKASREDRNEGLSGFSEQPLLWSSGAQSPGTFQAEGTNRASENNHPTVKPTELMRWLVRLVTPRGGAVVDPFMGSGSTGKAAAIEGFDFTGIEEDPRYIEIAKARMRYAAGPLFAEVDAA